MKNLSILKYPNSFLEKKADCINLDKINKKYLNDIVNQMKCLMKSNGGMGLAATQVGINMRLFIMDDAYNNKILVAINPIIKNYGRQIYEEEGCLSIPNVSTKIKRFFSTERKAYDHKGEHFILNYEGDLARCIQHEVDHLNGILYFKYLSPLKRKILKTKYIKKVSKHEIIN